jgi:hypothetical protein
MPVVRGYVRHDVITSTRARMCIGILITLLEPLFARHHAAKWPVHAVKSGVQGFSENYSARFKKRREGPTVEADHWALRCMDGAFRSLMKTTTPVYGSFA